MIDSIQVGTRRVGNQEPAFIIAEVGVNHNGDVDTAIELIDAAADAGADAVKFQSFSADALATAAAPKAAYQEQNDVQRSQQEMLRALELPASAWASLKDHAENRGIIFMSTPFDEGAADALEELDVPAFKVGSGELTNRNFLQNLAARGRPLLVSTGMATMQEVLEAQGWIGACPHMFFHCTSDYPAQPEDLNLQAIASMGAAAMVPIGYSDHSLGLEAAIAAVTLGACALEKHITLDPGAEGPDHAASASPEQFSEYVRAVRLVETMLGDGEKKPSRRELDTAKVARRSLVLANDLPAHHALAPGDLLSMRPGTGLPPALVDDLVGRRLAKDLPRHHLISMEDLE